MIFAQPGQRAGGAGGRPLLRSTPPAAAIDRGQHREPNGPQAKPMRGLSHVDPSAGNGGTRAEGEAPAGNGDGRQKLQKRA